MATRNVQLCAQHACRRLHFNIPVVALPLGFEQLHFGCTCHRETHARTLACQGFPKRAVFIVRRENGHTICRQRVDDFPVFLRHSVDRSHVLLVLALGVVDQGHGGLGHVGQACNFTGVVHTQLHHRTAVMRAQAQQGLRHADVVVQISLRGQGIVTETCVQDAGNHLRHGCLAIAACDGYDGQLKLTAPTFGQLTQRDARVDHFHACQMGGI